MTKPKGHGSSFGLPRCGASRKNLRRTFIGDMNALMERLGSSWRGAGRYKVSVKMSASNCRNVWQRALPDSEKALLTTAVPARPRSAEELLSRLRDVVEGEWD